MNEFHISRFSRDSYGLESLHFESIGQARQIAEQIGVSAADLYALGLIDEVLRLVIRQYDMGHSGLIKRAASFLDESLGADPVTSTQLTFTREFPPTSVYKGLLTPEEYLNIKPSSAPHKVDGRVVSLEELFLTHLHNANPAANPLESLFDDAPLEGTAYEQLIARMGKFFDQEVEAEGSKGGESLLDLLTAPARISPNSLSGQLEYLVTALGRPAGRGLCPAFAAWTGFHQRRNPTRGHRRFRRRSARAGISWRSSYPEYERFSEDKDWMPRAILMAKNTYVWLEQLSRKYGRWIKNLNDIPDEELDILAQRGFTGLWLIGLWERSRAPASASSSAWATMTRSLRLTRSTPTTSPKTWAAGARSKTCVTAPGSAASASQRTWSPTTWASTRKWVIEHPDWFLSLPYSPYPNYQFQSEDLCDDERVGVYPRRPLLQPL